MLGEREAVVIKVQPYGVHGVPHVELTLGFDDRTAEVARLGRESVPEGLVPGDRVLVRSVMRTIVEVTAIPGGDSDGP